jgi:hypothetical protein
MRHPTVHTYLELLNMVSETEDSAVGVLTGIGVASVLHSLPNTGPNKRNFTDKKILDCG